MAIPAGEDRQRPGPGTSPQPGGAATAPGEDTGQAPASGETGDPRVDEALGRLGELAERPVTSHPEVFEYVHERLAEALGELGDPDPGTHER